MWLALADWLWLGWLGLGLPYCCLALISLALFGWLALVKLD
jgi:hypothetical protein